MPQNKLRLNDMAIGDYWLMQNPTRLIRVVSADTVDEAIKGTTSVHTKPALKVRATVAGFEIRGLIGPRRADANRKINAAIIGNCAIGGMEGDDSEWVEYYTERLVPPVKTSKRDGGFDYVDDDPKKIGEWIPQFYCFELEGRYGARARMSMAARGQLEGVKIDPSLMPAKVFRDDPEPVVEPPPAATTTINTNPTTSTTVTIDDPKPRMTIFRARKLAGEAGIDVSDISGKGSMALILARLAAERDDATIGKEQLA